VTDTEVERTLELLEWGARMEKRPFSPRRASVQGVIQSSSGAHTRGNRLELAITEVEAARQDPGD